MSPRKELTLSEKNEILKKFDALPKCSQRVASKELGIPQSSLSRILQRRDAITTDISLNCNVERKRKRSGKASIIEHVLLDWYHKAKENNEPISRSILMKKSEEFAKKYHLDNFKATDGWLTRWKARNNITLKRQGPEVILAQNWIFENVPSILANYAPKQIYNTDKTELYIEDFSDNSTKSSKKDKIPLTVVLTCNMVGNRKLPLVIVKNTYLEIFRGMKTLPVQYEISEDGFMTGEIFASFLLEWDKTLGYENIVLLLDSSYVYLENLSLRNIRIIFIPSETVSIIQPLDQGIFKTFKTLYKKYVKTRVNNAVTDEKDSSAKNIEEMRLLDTMHMIANAWVNITDSYIYNCFKKAGLFLKSDQFGNNEINEVFEDSTKLIVNSDAWLSNYESTVLEQTDESAVSDKANESTFSDKADESVENSESSCMEIEKYLEQSMYEDKPITAKDTQSALLVLRKTLGQRNASDLCYGLLYKLENEIGKLLQKSS